MEGIKEKNFFKKIWTSIKDFEGYEEFAAGKVSKAIKYIILLTLIFTAIIGIAYTCKFYFAVESIKNYIKDNVENVTLKDGKLEVIADGSIIIVDENNIIPIIIVDTSKDANKEEYLEKLKAYDTGILLLSDKIIFESKLLNFKEAQNNSGLSVYNEMNENSLLYTSLIDFDIDGKDELLDLIGGQSLLYGTSVFFVTIFIYLFIVYITSNLIDAIVLGTLGYLFARIMKLRLRYKATFNIGIYALTLPILLNLIYIIVNMFTGFTINYFQWMYTTISYIYVVVAILMIKTEIINQKIQLIRLQEIQEQAAKEAEENDKTEEKKEENKENKDEEDNETEKKKTTDGEPEGSNA